MARTPFVLSRTLTFLAATLAFAAAAPGAASAADCPDADSDPALVAPAQITQATLCLVNAERTDRGIAALRTNARLAQAAAAHASDMVVRHYFAHASLDGRTFADRIKRTGYLTSALRWFVGENLAWGTGPYATPRAIVAAWMNSAGHRENILEAGFKEIGLGLAAGNPRDTSGEGGTYATEFGTVTLAPKRKATTKSKAKSTKSAKAKSVKKKKERR
jgi:uncharacterized protein YkwD